MTHHKGIAPKTPLHHAAHVASIHHSTWPMWYTQLQHTLMQVHNVAHWWGPGLLTVVGIPIAGWLLRYLLYEFPWFDSDKWTQGVRGVAFFALPTSYLLWFALPYAFIEIGLVAALVVVLGYVAIRTLGKRYVKVAAKFRQQAAAAGEAEARNPDLFDVIRGGHSLQLYRVDLPFTGVLEVKLWAETKEAALARTIELTNQYGFRCSQDKMCTQSTLDVRYHEHVFDGDRYMGKLKDVRVSHVVDDDN